MNRTKRVYLRSVPILIALVVILFSGTAVRPEAASADGLPTPDEVYESYRDNPYIRFYVGSQGIAWTSVCPGGYKVSSHGVYVYNGSQSLYRGQYGKTVVPQGVVGRREGMGPLMPGQHYYACPITNDVVPVGRWVLEHADGKCVHGPFEACRDYSFYGISGLSNVKCGGLYASGWKAYCADCGEPVAGLVYADEACVKDIGYILVGDSAFEKEYPVEYVYICPDCGDNLEVSFGSERHMCRSFVSCNKYTVMFDGNGADEGDMDPEDFYYGGADEYEGRSVVCPTALTENRYTRIGYKFCGWSDDPTGQRVFEDGASRESLESYFTSLSSSGDGSDGQVKTLYAVWKKTDSGLEISAGSFRDHNARYNGVENGSFEEGSNYFFKGYMDETYVDTGKLSTPNGYSITLKMLSGTQEMYSDTEFAGWKFESDSPGAHMQNSFGDHGFVIRGSMSGEMDGPESDGSFLYHHTSEVNGSTDRATALWKSAGFTLPDAPDEGMIFEGWYSSPDHDDKNYVGTAGDIIMPESDIVLYASYKGITLIAEPDYMGNPDFGELRYKGITHLSIRERSDDRIYKYFYSDTPYGGWKEAVTEEVPYEAFGRESSFMTGGEGYEYVAPVTGIYKIGLWGGAGASYDNYAGKQGDCNECEILLQKGDVLSVHTGTSGSVSSSGTGITCEGGEGSEVYLNGALIMSAAGGDGADFMLDVNKRFNYTGSVQTYQVTAEADYKLQVWGARGGSLAGVNNGANGGYAEGTVHLTAGSVLYICAGGSNGYNGGALGGRDAYGSRGGCGGGATHIASANGQLRSLSSNKSSVYLVAGGGGGAGGSGAKSGYGGGLEGGQGLSKWPGGESTSYGGTQTGPGKGNKHLPGGFGYGGQGYSYEDNDWDHAAVQNGGGGGGWYGGGGGDADHNSYGSGGAGGSGYIGGVSDGKMSNGVSTGNGYAVISCRISVEGMSHTGSETAFNSAGLRYRNHRVSVGDDTVYPDECEDKSGCCIITEPDVRYYESSDCSISSPDLAAPDKVADAELAYEKESGKVRVIWNMPFDDGTDYYYMARAYRVEDLLGGSDTGSGTTVETLKITTGTYAYYYLIDDISERSGTYVYENGIRLDSAWTALSGSSPNAVFTDWYGNTSDDDRKCSEVSFTPDGSDRYIHIVCEDRAGNVSDVFNMPVDGRNAHIPYPVVTEKLSIETAENVFKSPGQADTYYVRADGAAFFTLVYSAYIEGFARDTYQIEEARFCVSGSEYSSFLFSRSDITEIDAHPDCTAFSRTAAFPFVPTAPADIMRKENGVKLCFSESFTVLAEEEWMVYPRGAAVFERNSMGNDPADRKIFSDHDNDRSNGIRIIGDKTPPKCMVSVNGSEYTDLTECNISNAVSECIIDRRNESVSIDIYVSDDGAGVKNGFKVRVINTDNGYEDEFSESGTHMQLQLKMDEDSEDPVFENMLYNGFFFLEVSSEDNVGNELNAHSRGITELDASADIVRLLDEVSGPLYDASGERCMKSGESGYVSSKIWGYPDAVLVSFDDEALKEYDTLYVINDSFRPDDPVNTVMSERPGYLLELSTDFTIPLEYRGKKISVTVTAYKDDRKISWNATMRVKNLGSVLDELYTVLR